MGVLTLPQAIAWMGWVAGPLLLIAFYLVTLLSAHIISRLYMVDRIEFARYHHSVQYVLVRCSFPPGLVASATLLPACFANASCSMCRATGAPSLWQCSSAPTWC